jgi:hypothetical protein
MLSTLTHRGEPYWLQLASSGKSEGNDAQSSVSWQKIELFRKVAARTGGCARWVWSRLAPMPDAGATLGLMTDACRPRHELLLENAVLRHQVNVLRRKRPRPKLTRIDRLGLLLASAVLPGWRNAVALVQPATLLRWHRRGFEGFGDSSRGPAPVSPPAAPTIGLIRPSARARPGTGLVRPAAPS